MIDRVLEIKVNIKYPIYMSLKMILFIIVTHWGASAVFGIILFCLAALINISDSAPFKLIPNIVLNITILISLITTYIYFYITVRTLKSLEARDAGQTPESGLDLLIKKFKYYVISLYHTFALTYHVKLSIK